MNVFETSSCTSHGGVYKVYARLVVFMSKQCFSLSGAVCFVPSEALHPQAWFIMVHPLCCAPLGSELLFLSSTCGGMLPTLPSCILGQIPLNKERVCLRSLSDRKLRRSLKEVMGSNGNLLKRLSWPVGCCLDLLQSVNTLAAVLWSPARARHWMLLCVREKEGVQEDREGVN